MKSKVWIILLAVILVLSAVLSVVLLAPGCASQDMWSGYDARGNDFAAAARALEA